MQIAAIMQRSEQPRAAAFLNLTLETKTQLRERYKGVPIFSSCEEVLADTLCGRWPTTITFCGVRQMLADEATMSKLDGVIICTAHSCHASMGKMFLDAGVASMLEPCD